jgi:hypothetical protein
MSSAAASASSVASKPASAGIAAASVLTPAHLQSYVDKGTSPYNAEQIRAGEAARAALPIPFDVGEMTRRLRPASADASTPFVEPIYDPKIHLQLQSPKELTTLDFERIPLHKGTPLDGRSDVPLPSPTDDTTSTPSSLAYTSCFRVLSDEGIRVLRGIISSHGGLAQSNQRIACMIRNLGYVSPWIRAFNECPVLLEHISRLAGMRLEATYHHGSYSHVNFGVLPPKDSSALAPGPPGETDAERAARLQVPVDQWHADSVPFVLIIVLSDMEGMVGGEIECVRRRGREAGMKLIAETGNRVPESELLRVSYERMGFALFMQGCEMSVLHLQHVRAAPEPLGVMHRNNSFRSFLLFASFLF